jgi:hypothetical protein
VLDEQNRKIESSPAEKNPFCMAWKTAITAIGATVSSQLEEISSRLGDKEMG